MVSRLRPRSVPVMFECAQLRSHNFCMQTWTSQQSNYQPASRPCFSKVSAALLQSTNKSFWPTVPMSCSNIFKCLRDSLGHLVSRTRHIHHCSLQQQSQTRGSGFKRLKVGESRSYAATSTAMQSMPYKQLSNNSLALQVIGLLSTALGKGRLDSPIPQCTAESARTTIFHWQELDRPFRAAARSRSCAALAGLAHILSASDPVRRLLSSHCPWQAHQHA